MHDLVSSFHDIDNIILSGFILFLFPQIGSLAFLVTVPKEHSAVVTEEHSAEVTAEVSADVTGEKEPIVEAKNGATENTDMES